MDLMCNEGPKYHDPTHTEGKPDSKTAISNTIPITQIPSLTKDLALCNKPLCDDADMQCIIDLISATVCEAVTIIESDPRGLFCYKMPTKTFTGVSISSGLPSTVVIGGVAGAEQDPSTVQRNAPYVSADSGSSGLVRHALTIGNFEYANAISDVRDFISRWELSPDTKCVVISNANNHVVPIKGTIYFIDAHFSRPTPRCPNPLAVAKVRFIVTVSKLLLPCYPVMITYRFEGYNTLYYAVGERSLNSFTFQRFYIDTILHTKLSFFAAVAECRHGTVDHPKDNVKSRKSKKPSEKK
ncbi:uncharacterized protein [Drosophila bipectinata]|uniref:uncharacterized protein n=1 Tax=Drosophila bipectinata TaxID=42026 RepID=UPI001C8AB202|nr:uncharacterized protein LOC108131440 [Drosophila bipectinata]